MSLLITIEIEQLVEVGQMLPMPPGTPFDLWPHCDKLQIIGRIITSLEKDVFVGRAHIYDVFVIVHLSESDRVKRILAEYSD